MKIVLSTTTLLHDLLYHIVVLKTTYSYSERLIKSQDFMGQAPSVLKSFAFYTKSPYCSKLKFMNKNERKKEVLLAQSTQRGKKKRINYCAQKTHVL